MYLAEYNGNLSLVLSVATIADAMESFITLFIKIKGI